MKTYLITAAAALFLMGCAGEPVLTKLPADNPANHNATAAPYTPPDNLLLAEPDPPPSPESKQQGGMNHMNMNHGSMPGMDMQGMNMKNMHMKQMKMGNMYMNNHTTNHSHHHHTQGDQP